MSWSSDFRSTILRGRDYYFFSKIFKSFVVKSWQCLREGVRFCLQIFFIQRYTLQRHMLGEFFFSISQQIKVNGVTLDECILPYHFIMNLECNLWSSLKWLTSVIWMLQTTSSVLRRLYSRALQTDTSRRMHNKFRLVGGDFFKWKKEHVVGHEHFWDWSLEIIFFIKILILDN